MPGPLVSIVVLGTREQLLDPCLRAVAAAADPAVATETIVVDNAPGDGLGGLVRSIDPGAVVVRTPANTGSAAGWNLGFGRARSPWLALIHEDARPRPGWLAPLLETAVGSARRGIAGSRLLLPDGRVENGGWVIWRDGALTQLDERTAPDVVARAEPYPVDLCSSAAMLVHRDAWEAAGGFDERYFPATYADVDLAMAVGRLGRAVHSEPRSLVVHHKNAMVDERGGATASFAYQRFLVERNQERFAAKWAVALGSHAERDPGRPGWEQEPAAVARALCATAARAGARHDPAGVPRAERPLTSGGDDGLAERALRAQVEVQRSFCDWLVARHDAELEATRDAERAAAHAELERQDTGFRARLDEIYAERRQLLDRIQELSDPVDRS